MLILFSLFVSGTFNRKLHQYDLILSVCISVSIFDKTKCEVFVVLKLGAFGEKTDKHTNLGVKLVKILLNRSDQFASRQESVMLFIFPDSLKTSKKFRICGLIN